MEQKVAIVTDSTFDLPEDETESLRISVASVHVLADGKDYRDRIDITIEQANAMMLAGEVRLTTAAASAADFLEAYERALEIAPSLVVLTISPTLSATYQSARTAIEILDRGDVSLFETRTVSASQGLVVRRLAEMARAGADTAEVCAEAERLIDRVRMVLSTRTDGFTKAGGRYSRTEGASDAPEGFPVFRVWEKGWRELERAGTREAAYDSLLAWMRRDLDELGHRPGDALDVAVDHVVCPEDAEILRRRIEEAFRPAEVGIWRMAPTASVHLGPGTIGIAYLPLGAR